MPNTYLLIGLIVWYLIGFMGCMSLAIEQSERRAITIGAILISLIFSAGGLLTFFFASTETKMTENLPFLRYPERIISYILNMEVYRVK